MFEFINAASDLVRKLWVPIFAFYAGMVTMAIVTRKR